MKVLQRYFATEILTAVLFVLVAFLALFAFFDLIGELRYVGRTGYRWQHAFLFVLMSLPGYAYELMPIAVLIGTVYTLARLASNSEYTVMRAASMSTKTACIMLGKICLVFVVATVVLGELVTPFTAKLAEQMKRDAKGTSLKQEFRSGMWSKDQIRETVDGEVKGSRFLNVGQLHPNGELHDVRIYELDLEMNLQSIIRAKTAEYAGNHVWRLKGVTETVMGNGVGEVSMPSERFPSSVSVKTSETRDLISDITPNILAVLFVKPDRMSAYHLHLYKRHLEENHQESTRYQIAFWKKLIYPLSMFVMMAMALPFAYLHFRSGGISVKIFSGIMIGVGFVLINNLFSHIGLLNTWPPFLTAALPSAMFMLSSIGALWWVERH
ncbi:MAG: LPS export ABC transporter permease LptG [Oxalobacter sp.]|nr:MAG: LPS export ABC transporter permease LptG [Oxalobacter sp.]